ncbi:type I restriction-modification system specificity determinant [Hyphomicrobium denitrificans 1NES1]|uniref:Type I restriction-modification system specificity determinant n=2 Tax=Hyphomicrobium denitrificans TaxID=53399 RepID=N0B0R2_9HYPH|nr:type I restriction-modification system specificity determinant [Hyphomicrobium denitrificans 1NES1]
MIEDLKPYPEYKDSGVKWLGPVPKHWARSRIKHYLRETEERSRDGTGLLLSLTRSRGLIPQREASKKLASASDLSKYKVCHSGQLVMNRMQAWSGMFAVAKETGLVSPDYSVFRNISDGDVFYLDRLFKTPMLVDQFSQRSKGIGTGFNRLYSPDFGAIEVVVPPPTEQDAIVRFLDYADRQIHRYIRAKKKLIALLNEQKQAIIHRAVTRGLDPNVKLKPSGLEWIGDMPVNWTVLKLSQLTSRIGDGLHGTPKYVDASPFHFINGNNLVDGSISIRPTTRCVGEAEYLNHRVDLDETTLLMSINGTIGNVACYNYEKVILGKSAAYIKCNKRILRSFLFYYLQSPTVTEHYKLEVTGTTIFNLSLDSIRGTKVALPSVTEQLEIANFLDGETLRFKKAVSRISLEIECLSEYRARLIADVVTGKLDVREAAAKLPDFAVEPALLDEADDLLQDDSTAEEGEPEAEDEAA